MREKKERIVRRAVVMEKEKKGKSGRQDDWYGGLSLCARNDVWEEPRKR